MNVLGDVKGRRQAVPSNKSLFSSPLDGGPENQHVKRINSLGALDKVWDEGEGTGHREGLSLRQWAPTELTRAAPLSREKSYFLV